MQEDSKFTKSYDVLDQKKKSSWSHFEGKYSVFAFIRSVYEEDSGILWGQWLSSLRPKPGFGIGNQNQGPISVLVKFGLSEKHTKLFSLISTSWGI